jgi:hypothetical protein
MKVEGVPADVMSDHSLMHERLLWLSRGAEVK